MYIYIYYIYQLIQNYDIQWYRRFHRHVFWGFSGGPRWQGPPAGMGAMGAIGAIGAMGGITQGCMEGTKACAKMGEIGDSSIESWEIFMNHEGGAFL